MARLAGYRPDHLPWRSQ